MSCPFSRLRVTLPCSHLFPCASADVEKTPSSGLHVTLPLESPRVGSMLAHSSHIRVTPRGRAPFGPVTPISIVADPCPLWCRAHAGKLRYTSKEHTLS
ncbi:hypothetical protein B0T19DRAFT_411686 [Cercophora scortea]|uniref:Uncharacterized protein n=1 Tax=Cercophora scortea TaxID=314031 RepID=A0AAE0J5Z2_9PEZI|nr:hypothetical protein B0T19DRAFT_411686 [Cercophora scortea]